MSTSRTMTVNKKTAVWSQVLSEWKHIDGEGQRLSRMVTSILTNTSADYKKSWNRQKCADRSAFAKTCGQNWDTRTDYAISWNRGKSADRYAFNVAQQNGSIQTTATIYKQILRSKGANRPIRMYNINKRRALV